MSPQWKRIILLTLSTVALQGVFAALWRSSPSERFHASVPLLALLYFLLWQRHWPKVRWIYIVSLALGVLLFVWLLLGAQAHSLGGRVAWSEPFVWLYFLASLIVLYLVLRAGLMRLLEIIPIVKAWRAGAQSWLLHCLVSVGALAVFLPYLITTFDVHRFKVANATNPRAACGLSYEEVKFRAEGDGLLLSGWFIPRVGSDAAVLLCHGVGANKANFLRFVPFLHRAGFNVFIFDFRGHGDSAGHTVSFGPHEARDVRGAMQYLRGRREVKRIVAYAFSMGGSSLLHAISDLTEVRGVVVDSAFADMTTLARQQVSMLPGGVDVAMLAAIDLCVRLELGLPLSAISPRRHIAAISPRPLLIIHGTDDSLIPATEAQINFAAARDPKELWLVPGANHIKPMSVAGKEYERRVAEFLHKCVRDVPTRQSSTQE